MFEPPPTDQPATSQPLLTASVPSVIRTAGGKPVRKPTTDHKWPGATHASLRPTAYPPE